jgi:hypothetical protein
VFKELLRRIGGRRQPTATLVIEGTAQQAAFVHFALSKLLPSYCWKPPIYYNLGSTSKAKLEVCLGDLTYTWGPFVRRLLMRTGDIDREEFDDFTGTALRLDQCLRDILGTELVRYIADPADAYYICGSLPLELLLLEDVPLSLYASFYRFARPQDIFSLFAPLDTPEKLFIAPSYSAPSLAGINAVVARSTLWVAKDPTVTVVDGTITAAMLDKLKDRSFARLAFHGHATPAGILLSDGSVYGISSLARLVQGPAFLLGCATGAFEEVRIGAVASQVPRGLHGALLCAFPVPGDFTQRVNEIVSGTFREGDARRVQDIAHMTRLALTWMGAIDMVRLLSGRTIIPGVIVVTPYEAAYDRSYTSWGAGVAHLKREVRELMNPPALARSVLLGASAPAMGIVSCGTPAFPLPDADPQTRLAVERYVKWDGRI